MHHLFIYLRESLYFFFFFFSFPFFSYGSEEGWGVEKGNSRNTAWRADLC